jgi:hypothetical protein
VRSISPPRASGVNLLALMRVLVARYCVGDVAGERRGDGSSQGSGFGLVRLLDALPQGRDDRLRAMLP